MIRYHKKNNNKNSNFLESTIAVNICFTFLYSLGKINKFSDWVNGGRVKWACEKWLKIDRLQKWNYDCLSVFCCWHLQQNGLSTVRNSKEGAVVGILDIKVITCIILFWISFQLKFPIRYNVRATTGGMAANAWSLAGFWEIENSSGSMPVKRPPLWRPASLPAKNLPWRPCM